MPPREPLKEEKEEYRPFTVADFAAPPDRRSSIRRTPRMTLDALRLGRHAGSRHFAAPLAPQVVQAGSTAAQLLVARKIIQALVDFSNGAPASQLYLPFGAFI